MFQDYQALFISFNKSISKYNYNVTVIDSDFTDSIEVEVPFDGVGAAREIPSIVALIKIYENRKLNVAHNLFLLFLKLNRKYGFYTLIHQMTDYEEHVKEYFPYREQVLNYYIRYNKQKAFW